MNDIQSVLSDRMRFLLYSGLFGSAALWLSLVVPVDVRVELFVRYGLSWAFISLFAMCACFVVMLRDKLNTATSMEFRKLAMDAGLALFAVTLAVIVVPARSLIEGDESTMQLTAQAIRFLYTPIVSGAGMIDSDGILHPTVIYLEKRGIMYPAMLAALQSAGVPGLFAAWTINVFALWVLLFVSARITRRFASGIYPVLSMGLVAAFPLVLVMARIGTYDMVNFALLAALLHFGLSALRKPSETSVLAVAALAAVVTQIRYESVLPATFVIAALLIRRLLQGDGSVRPLLLATLPLWIAPGLWRMAMPIDMELPNESAVAWSVENAIGNLSSLLRWSFLGEGWGASQPLVAWLVCLGVIVLLLRRRFLLHLQTHRLDVVMLVGPVVLLIALLLPSFWGEISYILTTRYYIFYCVFLAIAASLVLRALGSGRRTVEAVAGVSALALMATSLSQARTAQLFEFPQAQYRDAVHDAVQRGYGPCSVLIAADMPGLLLHGSISAVHFQTWDALQIDVKPYLGAIGIFAVAAPLASREGVAFYGDTYRKDVVGAPVIAQGHSGPVSVELLELWRSEVPLEECAHRSLIRGIDRLDHRNAFRSPGVVF